MEHLFKPITPALLLFDDMPVSKPAPKKRQLSPEGRKVRVDPEVAKQRYYFSKQLRKLNSVYEMDSQKLAMKVPYNRFEAIPRGKERYYVSNLIRLGFQVQFDLV